MGLRHLNPLPICGKTRFILCVAMGLKNTAATKNLRLRIINCNQRAWRGTTAAPQISYNRLAFVATHVAHLRSPSRNSSGFFRGCGSPSLRYHTRAPSGLATVTQGSYHPSRSAVSCLRLNLSTLLDNHTQVRSDVKYTGVLSVTIPRSRTGRSSDLVG